MIDDQSIQKILSNLEIEKLNDLQRKCLTVISSEPEITVLSPTGTGKTLGFLLPISQFISSKSQIQVLILTPSRELALQIEGVWKKMGTGIKVNCFYGGHPFKDEVKNLSSPPSVLIGTPGRIADHFKRSAIHPDYIQTLVLDEFDKTLELGFGKEMEFILSKLPSLNKKILTSATNLHNLPEFIGIAKPRIINFLKENSITQLNFKKITAEGTDKLETLIGLISYLGNALTLVFCNHRDAVDRISEILKQRQIAHGTFHGGLDQEERERSLTKLRNESSPILLTTDLASRGLDIPEVKNIVHYQLPHKEDAYVHRNGRTARMNTSGTAYFVLAENENLPDFIHVEPEIIELPEVLQQSHTPKWITIYIGAGKKEKINKIDIVGFFIQKGNLLKEDLGLIEVKDHASYVAIKETKALTVLKLLKDQKIKNKKVKISLSR